MEQNKVPPREVCIAWMRPVPTEEWLGFAWMAFAPKLYERATASSMPYRRSSRGFAVVLMLAVIWTVAEGRDEHLGQTT